MHGRVYCAVFVLAGVIAAQLLGSIMGTGSRFWIDPILAAIGELPGEQRADAQGTLAEAVLHGFVGGWCLSACPVRWQCMAEYAVCGGLQGALGAARHFELHVT